MRLKFSAAVLLGLFMLSAGEATAATATAELIPAMVNLPALISIIKILLLVTFFIHIVLVNVLLGSSILASVNAWSSTPVVGYKLKGDTGFATGVLALAVNFGVAPFLFAQVAYGSFLYTSIVLMAAWWLAIPLLVILAYYALYIIKAAEPDSLMRRRVVISANTLLLMLIAFLLSSNSSLAVKPEAWRGWLISPGGTMLNLGDPTFAPRYLHVLAASVAVGGVFMALRARWALRKPGADKAQADARVKYGMDAFILASLAQALAGIWYLVSLPSEIRFMFFGGNLLFTGAIILVLIGLGVALWTARSGMVSLTAAFTSGIIFIMIIVRDLVRNAYLAPYGAQAKIYDGATVPGIPLPVHTGQGWAFAIFLLCTALGLVLILWMLHIAIKNFNGTTDMPHAGKGE